MKTESKMLNKASIRKATPIYSGVLKYFPLAIAEIAKVSKAGNDQHNAGQPLHWAREKSTDHLDALMRHLADYAGGNKIDSDGQLHIAKICWRALAQAQLDLEETDQNHNDKGN